MVPVTVEVLVILVGLAEIAFPVSHWWKSKARIKLARKVFPFSTERRLLIVCPSQSSTADSPNVATTHEDGLALAALLGKCVEYGISHSVKLHNQVTDDERSRDLFLICGPGGNSLTEELFRHPSVGIGFRFVSSTDGWSIVGNDSHVVHPKVDGRARDYGILARLRNPWSRPDTPTFVYLAAGLYGLGTWGATHYISNSIPSLAKHLRSTIGGFGIATRFTAIVEVKRQGVSTPIVHFQRAVEQ